eukprot:CAMPEP_0198145372 /NCGR_PEP_ID=MMETSP1443-20131203/23040_1 /TAXON_ID=186043 /ORGANISM="Entomoneis sp., Strain CCMP2396" /LENGTH=187 /DNA_ID=CAMNT_0043809001 /DNA_START=71 /DNA_END=634 /DNA_ORIENTATION=+
MTLAYEEADKLKGPAISTLASNLQIGGGSARDATHKKPSDTNEQTSKPKGPVKRSGRWTLDEKILFLYGLRRFGKGRWKKISIYLPDRSLVQIKSHAQKVLKRLDAGENVFRRLHENVKRTDALVSSIHIRYGIDPPDWWAKRKSQDAADVAEQFDAASALCQLSTKSSTGSDTPDATDSEPVLLSP